MTNHRRQFPASDHRLQWHLPQSCTSRNKSSERKATLHVFTLFSRAFFVDFHHRCPWRCQVRRSCTEVHKGGPGQDSTQPRWKWRHQFTGILPILPCVKGIAHLQNSWSKSFGYIWPRCWNVLSTNVLLFWCRDFVVRTITWRPSTNIWPEKAATSMPIQADLRAGDVVEGHDPHSTHCREINKWYNSYLSVSDEQVLRTQWCRIIEYHMNQEGMENWEMCWENGQTCVNGWWDLDSTSAWNLIPWKATQHHHTQKCIANAQEDVHHEQTEQVEELGGRPLLSPWLCLEMHDFEFFFTLKIKSFNLSPQGRKREVAKNVKEMISQMTRNYQKGTRWI